MTIAAALVAVAGISAGPAAVESAAQSGLPPATPPGVQQVSDEQFSTNWAYPTRRAAVRSRPASGSRRVARLRLLTEDGFPELYVVLQRWTDPQGRLWYRVRLPMRPNGRKGWVRENALGDLKLVRKMLEIDKKRLRATLYDKGKVVFSARIGVGKSGTPTPSGRFYIREKFPVRGKSIYGTHAIGTSAYAPSLSDWPGGGVVGLHGTNQPGLIPGRPSHGCIRLKNRDIQRLYRLAARGTPIRIH